jgi:hypothetical protein
LRDGGGESSLFGFERGFSAGGGGVFDLDLDFEAEPLLDELLEPVLLEALDDRDEEPLLDDERDELSLPVLISEQQLSK